ncbi:MAG: PaaI family thioesterase [Chloroflexi bacterium]|nr:PaaI family thioesterase [Chloroflexota bacterium]
MHPPQTTGTALQDIWPQATCYGCGPANPFGLQLKSYWSVDGQAVVAIHHPDPKYNAGFDNVMYGGLVASLMDCHSVWAAIAHAYRSEGREHGSLPSITYVTGRLDVRYLKPTPLNQPIYLHAVIEEIHGRKTKVFTQLGPEGQVTAEAHVLAVRIDADKALGASGTSDLA